MTHAQQLLDSYINRIVSALPDDLRDLAEELQEVIRYPDVSDWGLHSPQETWLFLADIGLPKSCPSMIDLDEEAQDLGKLVQIGINNCGDYVCIEKTTGAVVWVSHDGTEEMAQINKNPLAFLTSICAYDKHDLAQTREAIRAVDPAAVEEGQWWYCETA